MRQSSMHEAGTGETHSSTGSPQTAVAPLLTSFHTCTSEAVRKLVSGTRWLKQMQVDQVVKAPGLDGLKPMLTGFLPPSVRSATRCAEFMHG